MTPVAPPAGPHGAEGPRLARGLGIEVDAVLDLSQSLNPLAPDVAPLVVRAAEGVRRYPEPAAATEALAAALGVDPGRVLLTNGGAEAIALVAAAQPVGRVDDPEFSLYARHLERLDPAGPRWRSQPAQPDRGAGRRLGPGGGLGRGLLSAGHGEVDVGRRRRRRRGRGLVDQALRLPRVAHRLRARTRRGPDRPPAATPTACWLVNALALAAVPALLAVADLSDWSARVAGLRRDLVQALASVGLEALPSSANYVLVPWAPGMRERLAALRHRGAGHRIVRVRRRDPRGGPRCGRVGSTGLGPPGQQGVKVLTDIDAVLLDVGATLVEEAGAGTPVVQLEACPLPGVAEAVADLAANGMRAGPGDQHRDHGRGRRPGVAGPRRAGRALHRGRHQRRARCGQTLPEPLLEAARRLGVAPERCLYVGDRSIDQQAAVAAGMPFSATDDGLAAALARAAARGRRGSFLRAAAAVLPIDDDAAQAAAERHAALAKPQGSLGAIEALGARLAGIAGEVPPPVPRHPAVAVFAGDHGVLAQGVSPGRRGHRADRGQLLPATRRSTRWPAASAPRSRWSTWVSPPRCPPTRSSPPQRAAGYRRPRGRTGHDAGRRGRRAAGRGGRRGGVGRGGPTCSSA